MRSITLRRHEDEIKQLDADEAEIDMLARLAEAITGKYLNGTTHSDEPINANSLADETFEQDPQQKALAPLAVKIKQSVSPNFGTPLRRFVRR